MNRIDFINKAVKALESNITFAPQVGSYVIHGALQELWELHKTAAQQTMAENTQLQALILGFRQELRKYAQDPEKLAYPGDIAGETLLEGLLQQYDNYFGIETKQAGTPIK